MCSGMWSTRLRQCVSEKHYIHPLNPLTGGFSMSRLMPWGRGLRIHFLLLPCLLGDVIIFQQGFLPVTPPPPPIAQHTHTHTHTHTRTQPPCHHKTWHPSIIHHCKERTENAERGGREEELHSSTQLASHHTLHTQHTATNLQTSPATHWQQLKWNREVG